jgi:hypothetical protein
MADLETVRSRVNISESAALAVEYTRGRIWPKVVGKRPFTGAVTPRYPRTFPTAPGRLAVAVATDVSAHPVKVGVGVQVDPVLLQDTFGDGK